jgi:protein phosphatase 1 regulatory subunit 3A/B/C/D/E
MNEPSHCPPIWTVEFLAQVTKGVSAEVAPDPWEITFPQPASDYLQFRKRLDTENVSLENVIVKEADEVIIGTVKVRNLSFHKEVLVRATYDNWVTHEDAFCTFIPNNPISFGGTVNTSISTSYVLYDTFSFKLTLQPRSRKVEFCVCFKVNETEYWDNNNGKNYILIKSIPLSDSKLSINNNNQNEQQQPLQQRFNDALRAKIDSWSEFASWNHLVNDGPYW